MAKPWAKTEVGYMGHPKFLALSGNAISLWHEGKDYCARHQTDGIIPKAAIQMFRFRGTKSLTMLTTSCGQKPNGEPYAPLWEAHLLGYRMHDYLDHNDCRDAVLARLERADENRKAEAARKAEWRAKKDVLSRGTKAGTKRGTVPPSVPPMSRSKTEAVLETESPIKQDAPKKPAHPVRDFLKLYDELFFGLTGEHPNIMDGRDAAIAKRVIAKNTEEKARKLLELFFSSSDQFIQQSGYGLNIFAGQINKLLTQTGRPMAHATRAIWECLHLEQCSHRAMCSHKDNMPEKYPKRSAQVAS